MTNKSSKVLVTGSNGFIGSHLNKYLSKNNVNLTSVTHADGDIRKLELNLFGVQDQVIHLANKNFIPDSWKTPSDFFSINVEGTLNVLEYCRESGARLIYTSAYVYGEPKYLPIDEGHPVSGINPYMKSKILAEELVHFYSKYLGVSTVIVRPFNIIGTNQNNSFLIPTIVNQLKESNNIHIRSLKPKRDFLHIDDFCEAIFEIITKNQLTGVYNIGSGESFSVKEIIELFSEILGTSITYSEDSVERPNEVMDVVADISKIVSDTGWTPKLSIKEGLSKLAE
ncbi:MAG: 4,6-dehydratase LegB [Balneolaceae bacterium]